MPRKRLFFLLATSSFALLLFAVTFLKQDVVVEEGKEESSAPDNGSRHPNAISSPRDDTPALYILLWTTFFGTSDYLPSTESQKCQESRCVLTSDRSYLSKSSAVVFHFSDAVTSDLPPVRFPNQRWIVFTLESPIHSDLSNFDHLVNWTATYRLDSDLVTPYGHVRRLSAKEEEEKSLEPRKNYAASKTRMVAWFVSNCNTPSGRETFVQELQKVIPVDVYGHCGNFTCYPKMSPECYANISLQYRFYLSFENSLCKDYVTEKFFHILATEMIPVVFGDANYSRLAPRNSFIDALSYRSPEDLGRFLLVVASDEKKYNSFFEWKRHYALGGYHWVCAMCQKLHDPSAKPSVYNDLRQWWKEESNCWSWTPTHS